LYQNIRKMTALPNFITHKEKQKHTQPRLLTYDDYARLTPVDSGNYELHNGKIIFMPSPIDKHQDASMAISSYLYFHVKKNDLGKVLAAPMDTIFTPHDTFQPDVLFVSKERLHIIDRQVKGAPDFIVEVLSDGNSPKEMSYKKDIYESTGVKEYWFINLKKKTLTQYVNVNHKFVEKNVFKASNTEGVIQSIVVEGFEMKMSDIFQ
jgi:Uma2 family endonuclease